MIQSSRNSTWSSEPWKCCHCGVSVCVLQPAWGTCRNCDPTPLTSWPRRWWPSCLILPFAAPLTTGLWSILTCKGSGASTLPHFVRLYLPWWGDLMCALNWRTHLMILGKGAALCRATFQRLNLPTCGRAAATLQRMMMVRSAVWWMTFNVIPKELVSRLIVRLHKRMSPTER